jgi:RND family efflux transporter MFP subunit
MVRLKSEVDLSFKVGGVVTAVLVEEGAAVKKGQLLARLDPTEVDAALRQAKDGQAKADRDLERVRRLHASGALPVVELQNAETGASLARASVDAAGFNAQRAAIFAPDDGRIERRLVEPGEIAAPGRPAFHVSGRSKGAIVRLGLTDRDVLRVREGDIARVVLDARPELQLTAKVTQIAGMASPGSGTFDVEVRLDALPEGLLSGLTAKVEIHHDEAVAAVVSIGALVDGRGDRAAVFVVDGDRARKVPVRVAFLLGDRAALASSGESAGAAGIAGLAAETRVIEAGAAQLEDGARIRITQ